MSMTNAKFVELVLRKLGALSAGESASAEDYQDTKDLFDASLLSMHADGVLWWAVTVDDVAFTSDTATRPADYAKGIYASWAGRPVRFCERLEYERKEDKTETGDPEMLLDDGTNLILWPVPSAGNLRLTYLRKIVGTNQGDDVPVPDEIIRPLIDLIAYEIEPWFEVPAQKLQRIVQDAPRAVLQIRSLSRETAEQAPTQAEYF